VPNPF